MVTAKEIRKGHPQDIYRKDPLWGKYLLRRIAFPLSAMFINAGWSANQVSFLTMVILFIGLCLFTLSNYTANIIGAILLNLYILFDNVDGCIARATETKSIFGELLEAVNGYLIGSISYLVVGLAVAYSSPKLPLINFSPNYILLGAFTSICNLMIRVVNLKSQSILSMVKGQGKNSVRMNIGRRIDKEIGVGGFYHPVVFICAISDTLHYFVVFYFVYYLLSSVSFITITLIKFRSQFHKTLNA